MHDNHGVVSSVSPEVLLDIIKENKESLFPGWDFLNAEATLDLAPLEFDQLTSQMGIEPGYHLNTAPSYSPQALRKARQFLYNGGCESSWAPEADR